jgi:transportin-3
MRRGKLPDSSLLASLLTFISTALYDAGASSYAASAFKRICDSCCKYLVEFSDQLFSLYNTVIAGGNAQQRALDSEDVIEILEGLIFVVMAMEGEKKQASVQMLVNPILQPLQNILSGAVPAQEAQVYRLLEQVETVYKNITDKDIVMQLLDHTSSILDRALEMFGSNVECAEKVCSALKHGLKRSGKSTAQSLLQHLFTNIPLRFSRYSHPCMLYLSSELVKIFGGQAESHVWLQSLVSGLVAEAHKKLAEIKDFDNRPDIVDDLFLLAGRVLSYSPPIFFGEAGAQTLQSLFTCAMGGMFIHHREACISIYSFFYRLFTVDGSVHRDSSAVLGTVLMPSGLVLTKKLLAGITGSLPKQFLDDVGECLWKLLSAGKQVAISWLYDSLVCIPSTVLTDQEKQAFMTGAQEAVGATSVRAFQRHVKELSDVCRRNVRFREVTQSSLLSGIPAV